MSLPERIITASLGSGARVHIVPQTGTNACGCVKDHRPRPDYWEAHHRFPVGVQRELWGEVRERDTINLCPTAHRSCHLILTNLLRGSRPNRRGYNDLAYALAEEAERRIRDAYRGQYPDEGVS